MIIIKTAKQAFDETTNHLTNESNNELYEISLKINEAIKDGKYYISENKWINGFTLYELIRLGYNVSQDIYNGHPYCFISWLECGIYENKLVTNEPSNPSDNQSATNTNSKRNKRKFPIFRR